VKAEKIVEFLKVVGITNANRHKRTGWVISACPLGPWRHDNGHSSPEVFGVKIESGDPHCSCFACAYHGTLGSLVQRMIGLNKVQPRIEAKWGEANQLVWEAEETQEFDFDIPGIQEVLAQKKEGLHEFPEWWLGGFPRAWDVAWAREYLINRSVDKAMCDALLIELVAINSHHDLPFRLHHHRPMAVISEIDPQGIASCAALRSIAAYNPEMPVLLVAGDDPNVLGTIDAAEQLWCLSNLHRVAAPPAPSDLIGFLFQAGRHSGLGRLIPMS